MKIKASMLVISKLSDAQEEMNMGMINNATKNINFVKHIVQRHSDLNLEVDADALYHEFQIVMFNRTQNN